MNTPSPPNRKNTLGITLIEILICIAIVALLSALIVPTVGRFSKSSLQASDAATLRRLGVAHERFSQDHNNHLVIGLDRRNFFEKNPREDKFMSWMELLKPYLEITPGNVTQSPDLVSAADPSRGGATLLGPNKTHRSYGINSRTEWGEQPLSRLAIVRPSIFVILGNYDINAAGDSANINGGLSGGSNSLHRVPRDWFGNDTANFLFLDGHIEAIDVDRIFPGGDRYYLFNRDLNRPQNRDQPNSAFH